MLMSKKDIKIGLALGGGGALGYAHIGVLEVLKEHGINIDMVAGTSMGAIIGGAWACGLSTDHMRDIATKIKTHNLLDFNMQLKGGLLGGTSALKLIQNAVNVENFEDLKMPFACTASDLLSGEQVVLNKGNLIQAIRASMSIPGLFNPVDYEDRYLIDGGMLGNVPSQVVKDMGADFVIAIDIMGDYKLTSKPKLVPMVLLHTVFMQGSCITQKSINKENTDVLINMNLGYMKMLEFTKENAIRWIYHARRETEKAIPEIKKKLQELQEKMDKE